MGDDFVKNLPGVQRKVDNNNVQNMTKAGFLVSGESQRRAPLGPTGNLRANVSRSVFWVGNVLHFEFIHLEPYAEKQHDETSYNHPLGGEAEYAKNAMENKEGEVIKILGLGAFK